MKQRSASRYTGLLIGLLGLSCGAPPEPPGTAAVTKPIIMGADSTQGQFPTLTGLLLDATAIDQKNPNPLMPKCVQGTGACSGTLIREDVILTASHCVVNLLKKAIMDPSCQKDPAPPKFTFEVDLIGAARGMRVVASVKAVSHPEFDPTAVACTNPPSPSKWNDIALVFLKEPIKGAPIQKLARPADAATLLKEGSKVRVVGYGKSKVDDDMSAGVQRWGTATLVKVGEKELQAGQMGEQQACQGDSGGPVFANPDGPADQLVQIGVASRLRTMRCPSILDLFNPPKCENGVFYTRVDAYYDWIQATIEKERPTPAQQDMAQPQPAADMATAPEGEDLTVGNPPPPPQGGCKCDVAGQARGSATTAPLLLLLLGGGLLLRRRARRA